MTIREGLGYSLKNYDPCFDFNADMFCCSERGRAFRQNLHDMTDKGYEYNNYEQVGKFNPNDYAIPLNMQGIVTPSNYSMPPAGKSEIPCSRMPCTIAYNRLPCTNKPKQCHLDHPCGKN